MMDEIDVLVVGTDPPCPRCDLLTLRVHESAEKLERPVRVRHCFYFSDEAAAIGRAADRRVATPRQMSAESGIPVDWEQVDALVADRRRLVGPEARAAQTWTPEVDALIKPCSQAADAAGVYLTPILVVDGTVKHHGSVPTVEQIREWLVSA
jgi:Thioredoxin domain